MTLPSSIYAGPQMHAPQGEPYYCAQPQPRGGYAPQTQRVVNVKPVNHLMHLSLTVLTAGMWAPVWVLAVLNRNMTR